MAGILRCFSILDIGSEDAAAILTQAGLPRRALEDPSFPIHFESELTAFLWAFRKLGPRRPTISQIFHRRDKLGIESLGVVGMAMRHAATASEAYRILLRFPGQSWGHSRLIITASGDLLDFNYVMTIPTLPTATDDELERLVELCTVLDVVSAIRNNEDLVGPQMRPLSISLPFDEPWDWSGIGSTLEYPVRFRAAGAHMFYPRALVQTPLPKANPLSLEMFSRAAEQLSGDFDDEVSTSEKVTRSLWAQCPPMGRGEVAAQIGLSERSLTRRLTLEGTSFSSLHSRVQLERAQNFLRNRMLTVAEIAYRLGYSDPAAFTRAFTGWTGCSPSRWRARVRNESTRTKPTT